ncbi:ABC transporter permease [Anaerocolumna cellulosilytica]|uniref:ABC transporter permease n=1 Tax=Anaerocolumna cellulosilytica TaxID=433286 RepID=A0A6S6R5D7_9FIRM|nr:ABC transporter permease [Anaerocolumna cellulosilytica]MBB5197094.1 putative ABC transport system permease protein [Anaerocolumna cellulosilytica]BCJ95307.1 ABC transporter permease [Anaerocolumna cellulosilytica]
MGKNLYFKLAATNLKRDKKMYVPFTIAYITMVSIYFMVVTIMFSRGIADVPSADTLKSMFGLGMVVMTILMVTFMLYINSFLVKRRKKEFGLYGILGLEKRHVGRVIIWENLMLSAGAILLGIISGCVFGKLIFMLLYYSLHVSPKSKFDLPPEAFVITILLFAVIFILTSLFNLLQVSLANPIDLLKGGNIGEKKVRFVFIKTLLGLSFLGWAYYTASTVDHAIKALTQFFIAVMAVIIATNLLFEAGSLFFLTVLKKKKSFYYKANNFISISGMFHRMKQNASGLAAICILSTMVLVTVSTTTALYLGMDSIIKSMNRDDISITVQEEYSDKKYQEIIKKIETTADEYNVELEDILYYKYSDAFASLLDGEISRTREVPSNFDYDSIDYLTKYLIDVNFISLKDYNRMNNTEEVLEEQQVILLPGNSLDVTSKPKMPGTYEVKYVQKESKFTVRKNSSMEDKLFIVTADEKAEKELLQILKRGADEETERQSFIGINLRNPQTADEDFNRAIRDIFSESPKGFSSKSIIDDINEGYGVYGGLLFLGIFFAIEFLTATILIIYFKQVSEGYEDKERFVILQKVGMDDVEVKRTINKQILLVFFLPLVSALLHVAFARHMIIKLMELFYLYDTALTTWCMVVTCIVFMLAYILVYRLTAKVYYRLVRW